MKMYVILLVVSIVLPACFTEPSSCPDNNVNSNDLGKYEYAIFKWAPKTSECTSFRNKMSDSGNDEIKGTDECTLSIDCRRFQTARACYNTFYSDLKDGEKAKTDLDKCKDAAIATTCADVST